MSQNDVIVQKPETNTFELTTINIESTQKLDKVDEPTNLPAKEKEPIKQATEPEKQLQNFQKEKSLKVSTNNESIKNLNIINIKKEVSVIKPSTVSFSKREQKNNENSNKLPNVNNGNNKYPQPTAKKSIMRASTSNSTLPRTTMKMERLKNVLDEIKIPKREKKVSTAVPSTKLKGFPDAYEQKIIEYFLISTFYQNG